MQRSHCTEFGIKRRHAIWSPSSRGSPPPFGSVKVPWADAASLESNALVCGRIRISVGLAPRVSATRSAKGFETPAWLIPTGEPCATPIPAM